MIEIAPSEQHLLISYGLMGIKRLACVALRISNSNISVTTRSNGLRLVVIGVFKLKAIYVVLTRDFPQDFVALLRGFVVFGARHLIPMRP